MTVDVLCHELTMNREKPNVIGSELAALTAGIAR